MKQAWSASQSSSWLGNLQNVPSNSPKSVFVAQFRWLCYCPVKGRSWSGTLNQIRKWVMSRDCERWGWGGLGLFDKDRVSFFLLVIFCAKHSSWHVYDKGCIHIGCGVTLKWKIRDLLAVYLCHATLPRYPDRIADWRRRTISKGPKERYGVVACLLRTFSCFWNLRRKIQYASRGASFFPTLFQIRVSKSVKTYLIIICQ